MTNQYAANGYENERGYQAALNDELVPHITYCVKRTEDGLIVIGFVKKDLAQRMCDQMNNFCIRNGLMPRYEVTKYEPSPGC